MKVIDLLNKIANGEGLPKKVRYCGIFFENKDGDLVNNIGCSLFEHNTDDSELLLPMLNDEVEIIKDEEEKKIEKIYKLKSISASPQYCYTDTKNYHSKEIREMIRKRLYDHELYMLDLKTKINEIIDYLESKGDE